MAAVALVNTTMMATKKTLAKGNNVLITTRSMQGNAFKKRTADKAVLMVNELGIFQRNKPHTSVGIQTAALLVTLWILMDTQRVTSVPAICLNFIYQLLLL